MTIFNLQLFGLDLRSCFVSLWHIWIPLLLHTLLGEDTYSTRPLLLPHDNYPYTFY
jgi:hypothetical protein